MDRTDFQKFATRFARLACWIVPCLLVLSANFHFSLVVHFWRNQCSPTNSKTTQNFLPRLYYEDVFMPKFWLSKFGFRTLKLSGSHSVVLRRRCSSVHQKLRRARVIREWRLPPFSPVRKKSRGSQFVLWRASEDQFCSLTKRPAVHICRLLPHYRV